MKEKYCINDDKNLSALTNNIDGYSLLEETIQTRNSGDIVKVQGVLDNTEGLVPFDTYFDKSQQCSRNLDVGGGKYDTATNHVKNFYNIINLVYDLYNRTKEHNEKVLSDVAENPVDTATSFGVLNVILDENDRKKHISLLHRSLKQGGHAFFTVWRGTGTGIPKAPQLNRNAHSLLNEIGDVFGSTNVYSPEDDIGNTIIARK